MSTISEKLIMVADSVPKVYHAGQLDLIKDASPLKGFESDTTILLNDISPVEHTMGIKIHGKNLFCKDMDFNDNNFVPGNSYKYTYFIQLLPNTKYYVKIFNPLDPIYCGYTIINSGMSVASSTKTAVLVSGNWSTAEGDWNIEKALSTDDSGKLYIGNNKSLEDLKKAVQEANIQIELGNTAMEYTPYVSNLTKVTVRKFDCIGNEVAEYTANFDGTVEGVTSLYPSATLATDTNGIIIDCEYIKDINKAFEKMQDAIISLGGKV